MRARWWGASAAAAALLLIGLWLLRPAPQPPVAQAPSAQLPEPSAPSTPAPGEAPEPAKPAPPAEVTTSRLGVTVRLVRRPPIGVKPPFGAAYARLEPAARAGDLRSQFALGLLLYECHDLPADPAALERDIDRMRQTHRRGAWDVGDPALEERSLRERSADCEGVPQAARREYRDWLKRAADGGLIEAELQLPLYLPPGEWCQYLSECTPQQRAAQEALEKEAVEYLGRARDAGSADALWTFGAWYEQGEVLPRNDVEAYAHFLALDEINASAGGRRFDAMLEELRQRLRPIDIERAEARARELLANPKCCVMTP